MRYFSAVIHGTAGSGKTTLANTLPGPRLVIDCEGRSFDIPNEWDVWDLEESPSPIPPEDGWEAHKDMSVIVDCPDWATYRKMFEYIMVGDHPFRSVIVDSLTELQSILKEELNPQEEIGDRFERHSRDVWDQLLVNIEKDVRKFRNATRPSSPKQVNVCIVCHTDMEAMPKNLLLQGGIRKKINSLVDLEGYLHKVIDSNGNKRRALVIDDPDLVESKCGLRLLNEEHPSGVIYDPNFKKVFRTINPKENNNG